MNDKFKRLNVIIQRKTNVIFKKKIVLKILNKIRSNNQYFSQYSTHYRS